MKNTRNSCRLYARAVKSIPGGVNSPVRACRSVGADPLFIKSADGAVIVDADGNRYIDYIGSWGPMILGHRHPAVVKALQKVIDRGTSFGAPTDLEITLAEMVIAAVPAVEMVRMVNSGTEATMSAIRLARGYTGRDLVIKFDGCYHGHADTLLVAAGSGVATLGIPGSPGVPKPTAKQTLSLPYNNSECFRRVMAKQGDRVACVIVEPVAGNMGLVAPVKGFLKGLRSLTGEDGALLIFDEVITGFRLAYGGAQAVLGVMPDLTCLGKIIGGGLPVGAYGGRRDIMEMVAPSGPVYQAGTLSGNPLAMTAGIATLQALKSGSIYHQLEDKSAELEEGIIKAIKEVGAKAVVARCASMLTLFFTAGPVTDYQSAKKSDTSMFAKFFHGLLERGIYWPPAQFEAAFVSAAHNRTHISDTIKAVREALLLLKGR